MKYLPLLFLVAVAGGAVALTSCSPSRDRDEVLEGHALVLQSVVSYLTELQEQKLLPTAQELEKRKAKKKKQ